MLKRAFDIAAAATGLVVASPLLATAAVLVKLSSPGPILFHQQRVGRHGRPFNLVKFRSMRTGGGGPLVTAASDRRITWVGRALRRSKLDELPQLVNVLRGDLSFVGPRPEVARFVALYGADDRAFLQRVRPGITDPGTIRFRNEEQILARSSDPERTYVDELLSTKVRLHREYLEHASFLNDISILMDTLKAIARPARAAKSV